MKTSWQNGQPLYISPLPLTIHLLSSRSFYTVVWPWAAAKCWAEDGNSRKGSDCNTLGYPFSLCIYKERSRNHLKSFPYGFTCPTDSKESWPALTAMTPIRQELNVSCHHQSSHSHSQIGCRLKDSYRLSLSPIKSYYVSWWLHFHKK